MNKLIRVGIVEKEKVLPFVPTKENKRVNSKRAFEGFINNKIETINIPIGGQRYQLFASSIVCARCGIEGKYFAIERQHNGNPNKFHLNLYAVNDQGQEVLMTKDHIKPKSLGGENVLSNYNTMCVNCNRKKADTYDTSINNK